MSGHPLTQLIVVVAAGAAVSAVFGLLKALRGPVGLLAYAGLISTLYAYYRMDDRYFSQGIWQISVACLVVMGFTIKRVPFFRITLVVAFFEFASRINKTAYPHQTVLALGVIAAMLAIATFWTPRTPAAPTAPAAPPPPFGFPVPYRQPRQSKRSASSTLWRWARGRSRK